MAHWEPTGETESSKGPDTPSPQARHQPCPLGLEDPDHSRVLSSAEEHAQDRLVVRPVDIPQPTPALAETRLGVLDAKRGHLKTWGEAEKLE